MCASGQCTIVRRGLGTYSNIYVLIVDVTLQVPWTVQCALVVDVLMSAGAWESTVTYNVC